MNFQSNISQNNRGQINYRLWVWHIISFMIISVSLLCDKNATPGSFIIVVQRKPEFTWGESNSLTDVQTTKKKLQYCDVYCDCILRQIIHRYYCRCISTAKLFQHKMGKVFIFLTIHRKVYGQHWEKASVIRRDVTDTTDKYCLLTCNLKWSTFVAVFAIVMYPF